MLSVVSKIIYGFCLKLITYHPEGIYNMSPGSKSISKCFAFFTIGYFSVSIDVIEVGSPTNLLQHHWFHNIFSDRK